MITTTHETQELAIAAAQRQAIDEACGTGETAEGVALTDDGDTIIFTATPDGESSHRKVAGWIKAGHVNVSQQIEAMVY